MNPGSRISVVERLLLLLTGFVAMATASAGLDMRNATVERLDNGLTVILLEDANFPVVSVQMLYRVGARDETSGKTGLAHFLEHMAFRASDNFPNTDLVSTIYARGGEWHGYTWIDQTTYFATVPKEHLDLLLRIEADRMTRLAISPEDMEAERGSVLAELHMYENDPVSMLLDAVMFTSFLAHPYRNNTIGLQSDIEHLRHADVVAFYRHHYHPANAVLAVVGDMNADETRSRIRELFGSFEEKAATELPHTAEPPHDGERRVRLRGRPGGKRFMIAYHAPSANHPDFAAFLVLEALLGASSGINFLQNDWGSPADRDSILHGAADNLTTWFPPSAQSYLFVIGGTAKDRESESTIESRIDKRIAKLRRRPPSARLLSAAVDEVLDQLVFDLETTEDAAHQLAYFAGLHALDTLLALPQQVSAVTAADVQRIAQTYLLPERRSIAWYAAESRTLQPVIQTAAPIKASGARAPPSLAPDRSPVSAPAIGRLRGGIPVIVQPSDYSHAAYLKIVMPGRHRDAAVNDPVQGYSSLAFRFRPDKLEYTLASAALAVSDNEPTPAEAPSEDPETRLEQVFDDVMKSEHDSRRRAPAPVVVVLSGDVDPDHALTLLEKYFGESREQPQAEPATTRLDADELTIELGRRVAQAWLGYIVPAPGPREQKADAYRVLLYILSHGYEGRLGKEAISNRGLAYYIDGRYRSDGNSGWITLAAGVDPENIDALLDLLKAELQRLTDEPPAGSEVEEAKSYLIGRAISEAQSNEELATRAAEQWLWYGALQTPQTLTHKLAGVSREDVLNIVQSFESGTTIVVRGR